jgi:uroporphyrinogen-III synthase
LTGRRKTIAVLRAEDEALSTAARLAELGFLAVLAPVTASEALDPPVPVGRFDAVAATSSKALNLATTAWRARLTETPLYLVGRTGRRAAELLGLPVASEAPDAASLAPVMIAALTPGVRVLYLAGADRKPDLEDALRDAGLQVETVEIYLARAREAWDPAEAQAVAAAAAALHYSRRSAELAIRLAAAAGLTERWRAGVHVAISADAALPLQAAGMKKIFIAAEPTEASMFATLASIWTE